MKKKLLTETELRARWTPGKENICCVEEGVILTPAAKDFIREHGITLTDPRPAGGAVMTRTPIPVRDGRAVFVDAATGRKLHEKPEDMTHLRGNLLVPKTHPQIEFRGKLDSLMAQIMEAQLTAAEECPRLTADLGELLAYVRKILAAEVKDEPLPEVSLLGLDSAGIRHASHNVREAFGIDHPIPDYRMGRVCVALNRLRTQVRETELSAARAFQDEGGCRRPDIIEGLNRMSSCVYILFCRKLSGEYDKGNAV